MIFLFWCALHVVAMIVMGLLIPRRPYWSLSFSECLIVLLWYSVPFSALLEPSDPSPAQFTAGFAMYALGASLLTWAKRSNKYFQPRIVTPPEVIRTGAYKLCRHPGYAAMLSMGLGSALMVNAPVYGYFALALYAFILLLRAQEEDVLLASHGESQRNQGAGCRPQESAQSEE